MSSLRFMLLGLAILLCSFTETSFAKNLKNANVVGSIGGSQVKLTSATYDGNIFRLYQGERWAGEPHVTVFLFDHAKKIGAGKKVRIQSDAHVHMAFRDSQGDIDADVVIDTYDMTIQFGSPSKGYVHGKFELTVPKNKTKVNGKFRFKLGKKKK